MPVATTLCMSPRETPASFKAVSKTSVADFRRSNPTSALVLATTCPSLRTTTLAYFAPTSTPAVIIAFQFTPLVSSVPCFQRTLSTAPWFLSNRSPVRRPCCPQTETLEPFLALGQVCFPLCARSSLHNLGCNEAVLRQLSTAWQCSPSS